MIKKSELKLVHPDSEILRTAPEPFLFGKNVDAEMLANIMYDLMREYKGIGLSANQVGLNIKMFVMGAGDVSYAVFNPEIISTSNDLISMDEGCLTFPGIYMKVSRPVTVKARYQNIKGETVEEEFSGLTARIFLHEYDHMEGKTFKDRVSKIKWELAFNRMIKRNKKIIKRGVQKQLVNIANQVKEQYVDDSSRVS